VKATPLAYVFYPYLIRFPYVSEQSYGYLTNNTVPGLIAQPNHGATVVLEHRFFGQSNPYPDLSVPSLSVLTIEQAIGDLVYFAKNVNLPFPAAIEDGSQVGPDKNPWVSTIFLLIECVSPCVDSHWW